MNRAERRAASHQGNSSAVRLPVGVLAAFDRLAEIHADSPLKLPSWGRSVRIGVDYALRVSVPDQDANAQVCDSWAWACLVLGNATKADEARGDPPATCAGLDAAQRAGPDNARAFELLNQVRDCADAWARKGWPAPALPDASMAVLQRAARGERVNAAENLPAVLDAAQDLAGRLTYPLLREPRPA
jgi:hypothetical protein